MIYSTNHQWQLQKEIKEPEEKERMWIEMVTYSKSMEIL